MHAFAQNCRRELANLRHVIPMLVAVARVAVSLLFDAARGRVPLG
ncbi:MAG: hypothetical protein JWO31_1581 [Phycisphaerales bacterium]|nr:hypothetical protein [Phycisphaerales bacterium]